MAHGDVREGKWRGNRRMEWVASTLHTTSEHGLSSITTADTHTSAASSRLNWRPPADLNGLVRFAERLNLISARVPSHFNWPLLQVALRTSEREGIFASLYIGLSQLQKDTNQFLKTRGTAWYRLPVKVQCCNTDHQYPHSSSYLCFS